MPGIVGVISCRPAEECKGQVRSMLASMDHESFYLSGTDFMPDMGVYVGWVINDDSFDGGQPLFNEQRDISLILAGECFADAEIRLSLASKGHELKTNNDWPIHLYEEAGEPFIEKLNGLFSGLLVDRRQRKAFLFNDRYGSERIYWHQTEEATYFATEAKALLRVVPELRRFDDQGIAQFLMYGCTLEERTLFRNIRLLPAASVWLFDRGECHKRKYFSPESWESKPLLSTEVFQSTLTETFKRILPRYFESQTKIGVSLTGGLDTRMIMACRPGDVSNLVCYTFSGDRGETLMID